MILMFKTRDEWGVGGVGAGCNRTTGLTFRTRGDRFGDILTRRGKTKMKLLDVKKKDLAKIIKSNQTEKDMLCVFS